MDNETVRMTYQDACALAEAVTAGARKRAVELYPDDMRRQDHLVIGGLEAALGFALAGLPVRAPT